MQMLYDSESFVVVHMQADAPDELALADEGSAKAPGALAVPTLARHGFEIVDKRSGKEVYLDGAWAELFQQHISAWRLKTPTQEEVENTIDSYTGLAQHPITQH
ncbi:MAG: BTH_I0359 family protein [Burkholderiales bacterium]